MGKPALKITLDLTPDEMREAITEYIQRHYSSLKVSKVSFKLATGGSDPRGLDDHPVLSGAQATCAERDTISARMQASSHSSLAHQMDNCEGQDQR